MKYPPIACFVAASVALFRSVSGQEFVNLDFEGATIVPVTGVYPYGYVVATSNAVPGWSVYIGGSLQPLIAFNAPALGSTAVNLYATNGLQISGNFSVLLQGGLTASAASISQTGLVPLGTESLLFEAQPGRGMLAVSLGGQNIAFSALSTGPHYTLYGASISTFAGETEELTLSALEDLADANNWNIDDIQFSSSAVPEPSTLSLFVICIMLFGCWVKQRPNKSLQATANAPGSLSMSTWLFGVSGWRCLSSGR